MAHRKVTLLVVLVLCTQGCEWWRDWRRQSRLDDEAAKSLELIPAPARVSVPAVKLVPERPATRLVVTPDATHVDNTAFLGTLDSGLKEVFEGLGSTGISLDSKDIAGIGTAGLGKELPPPEKKKTPPPAEASSEPRKLNEHGVPGWNGLPVLGPGGSCPSVPRKGGQQDMDGLLALLKKLAAQAEQCNSAFLTARRDIPWTELAPTLSVLSLQAGFEGTVMTAGFDDPGEPDCKDGVPVEAIVAP